MEVGEDQALESGGAGGGGYSAGGPDRLSSLPDCLLHTIMSFMKARQAVQTCVLSTRWRNLWRSVPCLDIDFYEFTTTSIAPDVNSDSGSDDSSSSDEGTDSDGDSSDSDLESSDNDEDVPNSDEDISSSDEDSSSSDEDSSDSGPYFNGASPNLYSYSDKYKEWEGFEDFAVNLMRHCNIAQLDSFRLHIVRSKAPVFGNRQAAGWLRRAMKYCTPDRVSQQGRLSSGSWPLKRLHLCHVLLDNSFVKRVSTVCCSLEDLELDDCRCEIQSLTSHSLKTMVLKNCRWRSLCEITSPTLETLVIDGGSNAGDCVLVILAPAALYLHLAVKVDQFYGVVINKVPFLAKASIHLKGHSISRSKLGGDQFKLLCSVSNATSLELSRLGMRVLGKEPRFQNFKNLRNLILEKCNLSDDFQILVLFLQSSPNLEKVTLRHCKFPKYSNEKRGTSKPNKIASSALGGLGLLCENLKVEIIYKNGYGPYLIQLLLRILVNLSKNNIELTKVD